MPISSMMIDMTISSSIREKAVRSRLAGKMHMGMPPVIPEVRGESYRCLYHSPLTNFATHQFTDCLGINIWNLSVAPKAEQGSSK